MIKPERKMLRLKNRDYSEQGMYYITICVKDRTYLLWKDNVAINDEYRSEEMRLSETGLIVKDGINQITIHYDNIIVDRYVIMSNHVHMILNITNREGCKTENPSISRVIKQMKGYVTKRIGYVIWQKSFNDHVIRNKDEYLSIVQYIESNPRINAK